MRQAAVQLGISFESSKSYHRELLVYMLPGRRTSVSDCLTEVGTTELRKLVSDLRNIYSVEIADRWVKFTNRYGREGQHKQYWLTPAGQRTAAKLLRKGVI